jgi:hypothetical protein
MATMAALADASAGPSATQKSWQNESTSAQAITNAIAARTNGGREDDGTLWVNRFIAFTVADGLKARMERFIDRMNAFDLGRNLFR